MSIRINRLRFKSSPPQEAAFGSPIQGWITNAKNPRPHRGGRGFLVHHVRRTQLRSVSAVCVSAAKTAHPPSLSSFPKRESHGGLPFRYLRVRIWIAPVHRGNPNPNPFLNQTRARRQRAAAEKEKQGHRSMWRCLCRHMTSWPCFDVVPVAGLRLAALACISAA